MCKTFHQRAKCSINVQNVPSMCKIFHKYAKLPSICKAFHQCAKSSISWTHTISIMFAAGGWPGSSPFAILVTIRSSKGVSRSWSMSILFCFFLSRSTQLDEGQSIAPSPQVIVELNQLCSLLLRQRLLLWAFLCWPLRQKNIRDRFFIIRSVLKDLTLYLHMVWSGQNSQ